MYRQPTSFDMLLNGVKVALLVSLFIIGVHLALLLADEPTDTAPQPSDGVFSSIGDVPQVPPVPVVDADVQARLLREYVLGEANESPSPHGLEAGDTSVYPLSADKPAFSRDNVPAVPGVGPYDAHSMSWSLLDGGDGGTLLTPAQWKGS